MKEIAKEIKAAFDPYYQAPLYVWEYFALRGEIVEKQKNEILKKHNEVAGDFYFILEGSGGLLLYSNNNYICVELCYEGDFLLDYMSFLTNQPTGIEVVCFEKCRLFRMSRKNFNELSQTDYGKIICQTAAEISFVNRQAQQIDILTKTAEQRYIEILEKQPHILQRTPNKYIASYLGIAPESLSRIRKKIF
ncbi:MAG TPA: Crp/Fnr family transcriptional regulator [Bacteroidales bacterium]|jgi:CRP-like cAMP-binding protein|nr:MAG: Cyclic nucleotide-binding domain protein [Bacteroidetes bacterium ADurb.Bin217]HKM11730.1 Crp/Fnr family transcriptional regulator [Bacteroidales bacterium]HPY21498.1 Crp/Fnr family transcriptional regulator [Bacteroidales bacterium]HQP78339.1 Crp/Fnr family transcriptional regulator [Bacteroidales bacterium]